MRTIKNVLYYITVSSIISSIDASRILGIFPFPGKSHSIMFDAIMEGLAERNHQVDAITHFPIKNPPPNYRVVVDLNGTLPRKVNNVTVESLSNGHSGVNFLAEDVGNKLCDLLSLKEMQAFIKKSLDNPSYDLVITHAMAAHCYMGFGHLFNVPVVAVSTGIEMPWFSEFIGNDDNLAYVSDYLITRFDKQRFWDRLTNVLSRYWNARIFYDRIDKYQTDIMRRYLSSDTPNIRNIETNVALTLINGNPLMRGVKPMVPSLVDVSGLHIRENSSQLSLELKKWLDESTEGVVYFTFGSMVLIESLSVDTIVNFYKSFAKLAPMRVLMKIANKKKLPPGLPDNVRTFPWIPQQSVLAHKNTRIFITHGGTFGTQEALYFGVPMIGIPLSSDQFLTIAAFVAKKMAIKISLEKLSEKTLDKALNMVMNDPSYRNNAKRYSNLFKDRPMKPLDTAVFWIEYVIRHKKFPFVSPALNMPWWQLALLDVYGFILLTSIFLLIIMSCVLKVLLKLMYSIYCKRKID